MCARVDIQLSWVFFNIFLTLCVVCESLTAGFEVVELSLWDVILIVRTSRPVHLHGACAVSVV